MSDNTLLTLFTRDDTNRIVAEFSALPSQRLAQSAASYENAADAADLMLRSVTTHTKHISRVHHDRGKATLSHITEGLRVLSEAAASGRAFDYASDYWVDLGERWILTLDTLRQRGDIFLEHENAGCPPVLAYDYEVVMDGADLPRPCNYQLLRILPPEGVEILARKRPYIIVDPRAGHGAGIGGFKPDSQVGVALADGHPVYFVSFRKDPEPGQTLADVTRAEGEFVRAVMRLHPESPRPVIAGNCQGGWATLLIAATNPDLTGPIVLNGAPVAPWSGEVGTNPMRYNAGILGGTWQPMFWSDIGGGVFDGANLVMNFEQLNPSRNHFRKYYDLFTDVDQGRQRFLDFERWWGGYFLLNEPEIRWIVSELFVGNRLVKNLAQLEPGRPVDLKRIQAPIIVFTSHGDNITPPQQALNWIVDTYASVDEIKIRGQRIIYMVHPAVGHLGIFVSSKIAKKEHTEVASTMKTIEQLAPGLYEMVVDSVEGHGHDQCFYVSFAERTFDDLRQIDDGREDEAAFAAVARASALQAEYYDIMLRPAVKAAVTEPVAHASRIMHPLRMQRWMMSSLNPVMAPIKDAAQQVDASRRPAAADNPFRVVEGITADLIEQSLDVYRDMRDAWYEMTFFALWGSPFAHAFGKPNGLHRTLKAEEELRELPEVRMALMHMDQGGFEEAVIRMLIVLADSRGTVRRDRLERSSRVLTQDEPFRSLAADERARIIHEQTLIVTYGGEEAITTLPLLLKTDEERERAARVVQFIPGPIDEMAPHTLETLQRLRTVLGLSPLVEDVSDDPLADPDGKPWFDVMGSAAE